jgi:aspartyl protease family protein
MSRLSIALLIALAAFALIIFFSGDSLSTESMMSLIYMGIIAALVSASMVGLFKHKTRETVNAIALWAGIVGLIAIVYVLKGDFIAFGNRLTGVQSENAESVTLFKRNSHFETKASINGMPAIALMVDTGASVVVLTHQDAKQSGFIVDGLIYDRDINTANGKARAASLTLKTIQIGTITLERVPALIAQQDKLNTSLLGMSFLSKLKSYSVEGDKMMLKGF